MSGHRKYMAFRRSELASLRWFFLALLFVLLAAREAAAANAPPMIIPGQFDVSATGAATYTIPIVVPPGTAGMVPALSLQYSSQSGDGIEGIGWTLSGLSSITRCPSTIAQDNSHGSVNYSSTDKLCLDGQRLIYTNVGGTGYGTDGAIYHTEIESFSKIVEHNPINSTSSYFEVWTKSGQYMVFGNTPDSAVLTVGLGTNVIRAWAVSKITDTTHNYLTVTYNCASGPSCTDRTVNGEAYPVEIDYTGNSAVGVSPYNSVRFSYSNRADYVPMYQAGASVSTTVVLTDIKTFQGSSHLVYDYHLGYRPGTTTTHSRITDVTLCDSDTACATPATCNTHCLKQTTFGWQGGTGYSTLNSAASSVTSGNFLVVPADWNADGLTDLALIANLSKCPPYPVYLGTPSSGFVYTTDYTLTNGASAYPSCSVNPLTQTLLAPNGTSTVSLSLTAQSPPSPIQVFFSLISGTGAFANLPQPPPPPGFSEYLDTAFAGDYNGDGILDFFLAGTPTSYTYLGNTSGGFTTDSGHSGFSNSTVLPTDFDGDGCTDFYVKSATDSVVYSYYCHPAAPSASPPSASGYQMTLGDFNGDGKTDILLTSSTAAGQLWLSTGTGFVKVSSAIPSTFGSYQIFVGDWNGDGKADLFLASPSGLGQYYLSTGTGFTPAVDANNNPITFGISFTSIGVVVADWNNDGASDILLQNLGSPSGGDTFYQLSYTPELMTSISNGIGSTTNITYDRINKNGSFYSKGSAQNYPIQVLDGPLYVVSRVDSSNGLGTCALPGGANCYYSTYSYTGAQVNLQGRGFMGFTAVAIQDAQTNITQTTTYSTTFPTAGMILSQTKTHTGNVHPLQSIVNTYLTNGNCGASVSPPAGIYQVCLVTNVTSGYDLDDIAQLPTTTTNYTYDSSGNALTVNVSVSDGSYKNTTNVYNNDIVDWLLGRLQSTVVNSVVGSSNLTRQSCFLYDASSGLLTREMIQPDTLSTCTSGAYSLTTDYTYDLFGHRVITQVSGPDILTRRSYVYYDALGEFMTVVVNALGQGEAWSYDPASGQPISHTGPNFLTTTWIYDTFGRVTQENRPDGILTQRSYGYCAGSCPVYGQFYSQGEAFAHDGVTQIGPVNVTYYDMLSRNLASDTQGFSGNNTRVTTVYDPNGRVQESSRPYFTTGMSPAWTQFAYDDLGRVTQTTYPDSSISKYCYSGLTNWVTNNLGQTTEIKNNAQGLKASVTTGTVTGGLPCGTDGSGTNPTTGYVYDAFGNSIAVMDPAGNVVSNRFDVRGRKVTSNDPDMGNWTYGYDVLGELTSQVDGKSQATTLMYDVLGRLLSRTEADLYSAWTYGTSAVSHNIGSVIEAKTCPTSACTITLSDKTFTFDGLGREIQFVLQTPSDYLGYSTTYNTTNAQIASVTYPSGYSVSRYYNSRGFLVQLIDANNAPVWTINTRDAELHITSQTAGNNVTTTQSFDPNTGLMQSQRAGSSGNVASFDYTFDTIGNLQSRADNNAPYTERFCYDSLNRLTTYALTSSTTCPIAGAASTTITYDAVGNITSKSDVGAYNYNGPRPHAISSITGTVDGLANPQYAYDGNGNLICTSSGSPCSGTVGRMIGITSFNATASIVQGSNSLALTYDEQHQRLQQTNTASGTNTTQTIYINDPATGAMGERVMSGTTVPTIWNNFQWGAAPWGGTTSNTLATWTDYISIDGQIVAQRKVAYPITNAWGFSTWGDPSFTWGPGGVTLWGSAAASNPPRFIWGTDPWNANPTAVSWLYFNLDHLGSVAVVTDQSGTVLQHLSYDAWGKQRNPNGTAANCGTISAPTTRGFTGQEEMPTQCLVNLNARLYDTSIGKFLAADPIVGDPYAPNAFNRYSYVLSNPLSFTDPSGLCFLGCFWKSPVFGALAGVGLAAIGLPELEAAIGITVPSAGGAAAAFSAASASGLTVVNGAIVGAATAGLSGSNVLKGAAFGAFSAGLSYGVGQLGVTGAVGGVLQSAGIGPAASNVISGVLVQGAVGGIASVVGGEKFGSGFLAAGVGSLAGGLSGGSFDAGKMIASAALGGVASVLGGGKFANGALSASFAYAASADFDTPQNAGYASPGGVLGISRSGVAGPFLWNMVQECVGTYCGAQIFLKYTDASDFDWLQTFSVGSQHDVVDDGTGNGEINPDSPFYPQALLKDNGTILSDWPSFSAGRTFVAYTSAVLQDSSGAYSISATVRWGYTWVAGTGVSGVKFITPIVTAAPSAQLGVIKSLNQGH